MNLLDDKSVYIKGDIMFDYLIGLSEVAEDTKIFKREAVRAIIYKNKELLMLGSSMNDYKLPGGGIENSESHEQALAREVAEETGWRVSRVGKYLGKVTERRWDLFEPNQIFEMVSHYYSCDICGEQGNMTLDDYEKDLNFQPLWITLSGAIKNNEDLLASRGQQESTWLTRELFVLKKLETLKDVVMVKGNNNEKKQ